MAERRMFAKTIIDSDAFIDMPLSAQCLYFHLSMRADDEGFINNPKKIMRMIGASEDDFKLLIAKSFLIIFESGVVVIKHWKIHNYIRNDRLKDTMYQEEKSLLNMKENGAYTLCLSNVSHLDDKMDTQYRIGKDRIGKVNEEEKQYLEESVDLINSRLIEVGLNKEQADEIKEMILLAYELTGNIPSLSKLQDIINKVCDGCVFNPQGYIFNAFKNEGALNEKWFKERNI